MSARKQIDKLASYLLANEMGPNEGEGAGDTAIRWLEKLRATKQETKP